MRTMVAALGAAGLSLSMIVGTARAVHAPARMPTATIIPLQIELKVDTLSLETAQGVVTGTCRRCHNDERMRGNMSLDAFDVEILRTLFMIRYVDLVKGTLDNLVTLSITRIDDDRLAIRERLEGTLARLEKESLVTRNGEEYLFLTNEERDITRKIKATEITSSDENKLLAEMIVVPDHPLRAKIDSMLEELAWKLMHDPATQDDQENRDNHND